MTFNTSQAGLRRALRSVLQSAIAGAALCTVAAAGPKGPNVLFIAVDDLRPELGCYGNRVVKSPHIDRLARRGTTFVSAYCQQAVCAPSRSSLMTGRYPDATRVWDLRTHFRVALPDAVTVSQYFKQNGYHCASLGKIYHRNYEDGASWSEPAWFAAGMTIDTDPMDFRNKKTVRLGPGVNEYGAAEGEADPDDMRGARKKAAYAASPKSDDELPDGATAVEAVNRLRQYKQKGQPFFLAVGFVKPHLPFVSPKKYWDLYDPARIPVPATDRLPEGAPAFAGHDSGEVHAYGNIPTGNPLPENVARELRHGYYAAISYMDAQVGRVLDALEKEGLTDSTVIVLWGDHGWQLGDHGLWAKHTNFELATRSPLIISLPNQKVAGTRSSSLVEFVDIYPTLAEACGLRIPASLDGKSLMPILADPKATVRQVAMSQYPRGGGPGAGRNLMGYSIRDERWRLTLWRDRRDGRIAATELYDEANDPAETKNLADINPEVVARLARHIPPLKPMTGTDPVKAETRGEKASSDKQAEGSTNSPVTAVAEGGTTKPAQDRADLFAKKDRNQDGKLSVEEFIAYQADEDAARKRFEKWDADRSGSLSKDEFVAMGRK